MKGAFSFMLVIIACLGCNSINKYSKAKLISSSKHIFVGELNESFKADKDPNTVEYVFIKSGESWVSNDGQVIYINENVETGQTAKLLDESTVKRLQILNKL